MAPLSLTAEEIDASADVLKTKHHELEEKTTCCQVCFDDIANDLEDDEQAVVVAGICSADCPAVLCRGCLADHVRVTVSAAFPGVFPKVRCPICLVPVNKSKWETIVTQEVLDAYTTACRVACSFQTPCCHDTTYSHLPYLPDSKDLPSRYIHPQPLELESSLENKRELLREQTDRFCNHAVSSKSLITFIEDEFGRHVPLVTQHLIVEHTLLDIADEERRATLMLSYHAKYKAVTTRCCGYSVCFNCKRHMSSHSRPDVCDENVLCDSAIVECRSCHVTMVKVEGCDAVRCWCGFSMDWTKELRLRDRHRKGVLPVDLFDIDLVNTWEEWQTRLLRYLTEELFPMRMAVRLSQIDQLLGISSLRLPLLVMLQHKLWFRRFRRCLSTLQVEMKFKRLDWVAKTLREQHDKTFVEAVRRAAWRRRLRVALTPLEHEARVIRLGWAAKFLRENHAATFVDTFRRRIWRKRLERSVPAMKQEIHTTRLDWAARRLRTKHTSFGECVGRAKWRRHWPKVMEEIFRNQFWLQYHQQHHEDLQELKSEELVMLMPGF